MGELTLLHPWLLAGLAGATLPVLIHLIGRRRAPTLRFAAFDFLLAVNKRLARRERLRQLLLLLLRTLAIIALVLAIARPMPHRPAVANDASRRLVLVIDASGSMAYQREGKDLLSLAKRLASDVVSHLQPGDAATLVVAGEDTHTPFQAPTLDHAAVRAAIDAIAEPKGVADLGVAIDNGLGQLGADGAGATLVIVSDLAQNSFETLRPTELDPPPVVRLIDAAERERPAALSNLAIESVGVERSDRAVSGRRFEVVVRNFGSTSVMDRVIELSIDGKVKQRGYVEVPARGSEEKVLTHTFEGPGVYWVKVRLAPEATDGFLRDDEASVVTEIVPGVRVLAVDGDPRTTPYEDELFFIERALEAVPQGDPPIDLRIVTVDELPGVELTGFDVVILANVGELSTPALDALRRLVRDGGGLLFTLGDRIRFEAANEIFEGLLPYPLRDLHRAADPDAGTPPIGIGDIDWDHPVLDGLGLPVEQSLHASRTLSYFNLGVGSGLKVRPILRFENGAPALVERREGAGRVMLLTTSADVDLSDLPLRSAFPPVLQRTVRYLAAAVEGGSPMPVREGGTVQIGMPTGSRGVRLTSASGRRREIRLEEPGARRVQFSAIDEPGLHRAEVLRDEWERSARLDVAVNPSLEESDFAPVSADRISEAMGREDDDQRISVLVGAGEEGDPFEIRGFGSYLLFALCFLFIGESLLASRG